MLPSLLLSFYLMPVKDHSAMDLFVLKATLIADVVAFRIQLTKTYQRQAPYIRKVQKRLPDRGFQTPQPIHCTNFNSPFRSIDFGLSIGRAKIRSHTSCAKGPKPLLTANGTV